MELFQSNNYFTRDKYPSSPTSRPSIYIMSYSLPINNKMEVGHIKYNRWL